VGQRQEQQRGGLVALEQLGEALQCTGELAAEVAVGELAALGPAGGAGRVDERGQRVGAEGLAAAVERVVGDLGAGLDDTVEADSLTGCVDGPDILQLGGLCAGFRHT
jgi:hypothetical protein